MLLDSLLAALKALKANVLRSVLTTLGIIIGVGAVIIMVSVGSGAESRVQELIRSLGSNLIIILSGTTTSGGVRLGHGSLPTITEDDAAAIQRDIPSVQYAACNVRGGGQVVFGNLNWSTLIYGITPEFMPTREWEVDSGRMFNQEESKGAGQGGHVGARPWSRIFFPAPTRWGRPSA